LRHLNSIAMKGATQLLSVLLLTLGLCFLNSPESKAQEFNLESFYKAYQEVEIAREAPAGDFNNSEGLGGFSLWQENGKNTWSSTAITSEETGEWDFQNGQLYLKRTNGEQLQFDLIRFKNAHILVEPAKREVFARLLKAYNDEKVKQEFRSIHIYRFFSQQGFFIQVNSSRS
jgi:hypothetical protein